MNVYWDVQQNMMQNQSTWLITGVAGFIGSNLLEALLRLNQKIIGLDNFCTGTKSNLEEVARKFPQQFQANFKLIEGDICSAEDCERVMDGVDFILHHAAAVSVPLSIQFPEHTNAVNVSGFINILNAAKKAGVKRLVYASSSAVYGDSPIAKKNEGCGLAPLSPYAVSKYANELYAKSFGVCLGLEAIGLRYFNIYGPKQNPKGEYAAVIPLWIDSILKGKPVYVFGDGSSCRDFCYIDDVVQANLLAALTTKSSALNQVYNIGCGMEITLTQLLNYLQETMEEKFEVTYQEFRTGDIKISSADISSAMRNLGFVPATPPKEGLIKTINYYKEQNKSFELRAEEKRVLESAS
ncbi:NAD-dependent epimerase/dehydratase family protein [Fluoribacter dumoffii]|uniref:dTDP-glucose 4,6-dehydratase n=1 Tax=Fluoribacter dumoffii TaxID=463 RepID=A0A377G5N6_9GAMM|nr:NAD-dependent epimerase/dehydratase family protein [Fluoribacter dumoffii]KTC91658.1 UDP-glucuronate 5'-epimerase [Fluoribacter dumoffii NY 23]MCW8387217.1 NAD-dependent epimerase/dehydratase family protein [Fluoribacter dumoffii]MCW8417277.1 NAD-dependent epimerase/dehydratase family protein [Fluoribacter dumoffii]MCW8454882.1 NAD-dependent epimerase/dehydratase family protein [Fluoribacter dumoffii]MCW8461041.1 NAD-dependent epimerase/dehydratase family protein [Fluoribacter dumoffii]